MKTIVTAVLVVLLGAVLLDRLGGLPPGAGYQAPAAAPGAATDGAPAGAARPASAGDGSGVAGQGAASGAAAARQAFEDRAQGRLLELTGTVERTLADDRDGSPHQRFIIRLEGGQTLLVAHNLDLAPRLDGLRAGDTVRVFGEFEWNPQGGVMHWTHHDPRGVHPAGFIEWRGRRFQ